MQEEFERIDEEEWPLQDVIFVEDSKNQPVGKVLKVDGPYCAVKFFSSQDKNKARKEGRTNLTWTDSTTFLKIKIKF